MSKTAILQMADAGPAESTALMLRAVGYEVFLPNDSLRAELRNIGCDTILSPKELTRSMGYDRLVMPEVGPEAMETCDLYCCIKAHRTYPLIVKRWPRLENRILWTRINGGMPEHVVNERGDHGDEINPPCPVLTPNQWYGKCEHCRGTGNEPYKGKYEDSELCQNCDHCMGYDFSSESAYAAWPPFYRFDEYYPVHGRPPMQGRSDFDPPICLIHGVNGWGYRDLVDNMRAMGVRVYGKGSPDGLVKHAEIPAMLSRAKCMVHLKSSDSPGYAIYESLAANCPIICTRRLIWRCKMQELLIPGETCLVFDRETHEGLTAADVESCTREVKEHLDRLSDHDENWRIGNNGRQRLREIMWNESRKEDVESLREFMERHFG